MPIELCARRERARLRKRDRIVNLRGNLGIQCLVRGLIHQAVVFQQLLPKIEGGRFALLEIMGANLRTQESIRLGESEGKSFYEIIEASYTFGWRTFDHACLEAYEQLKAERIKARVVSMPSWELFDDQPQAYRDRVLPPGVTKYAP